MIQPQPVAMPSVPMPAAPADGSSFYVHSPHGDADRVAKDAVDHGGNSDEIELAGYFRIKTVVDRLVTAVLCAIALPVLLMVVLAILLLDGRPVFYRQLRVGKNGRVFRIWKFRTMRQDAERATGAVWSSLSDPRVTRLGRWLRCSHLDELPQFFNILAGEMNLIGPRPERPEFADELAREIPGYGRRTAVRPGITGLAQLRLGYDDSVAHVRKKVRLDLRYIRTASVARDARLLVRTLPYVAKQLRQKWTAARRPVPASSIPSEAELAKTLVPPPLRCDQADNVTMASPHFLHNLPKTGESIDRVKGECASSTFEANKA